MATSASSIFNFKHITASTVVAGSGAAGSTGSDNTAGPQAVLHTLIINSGAAASTVQVFDYNSTSSPPAGSAVTGVITAPTGGYGAPVSLGFDALMTTGITVVITGTTDITVTYR